MSQVNQEEQQTISFFKISFIRYTRTLTTFGLLHTIVSPTYNIIIFQRNATYMMEDSHTNLLKWNICGCISLTMMICPPALDQPIGLNATGYGIPA